MIKHPPALGLMKCALPLLLALSGCDWGPASIVSHPATFSAGDSPGAKVVFLAGRNSHGPGAHDHKGGSELLSQALQARRPDIETVNVYGGWPEDESIFTDASTLVLYCDGGKGHLINDHLASFNKMVAQGVGVVALHYCVEVPKGSLAADAMLEAVGGHFETEWSVNPHWEATFTSLPKHPASEGITPFAMLDEWYFNMRFQPEMKGVTAILSAVAPEATMERRNGPHSGNDTVRKLVADGVPQITAWAYERENGGRGFGYTGGHFHDNWQNDSARNLVLNAIEWSAKDSKQSP
ncbi:MAG: type 1 glutamine amidotransferase [Halioglobus sp.]|jgi:type 1 glutamine amidotransferase